MAAANLARRSAAAILGLLALATWASVAEAADGFAIVGATVFDGTGAAPLLDAVIVVEKGKVRSVGPRAMVPLPKGVTYIDGRGLFAVPGRVREAKVADAVREKVAGGAAFAPALREALRADAGSPSGTIEPDGPGDLVLLAKDPRLGVDPLGSATRTFVAGREVER